MCLWVLEMGIDRRDTDPGEWGVGVGSKMAHVFHNLDDQPR